MSLFGGGAQQQSAFGGGGGTGLFSQPQQPAGQAGSLFGGGGGIAAQPPATGGLFGQQQPQATQGAFGGLGAQSQAPQGQGLFGQPKPPGQPGAFGATNPGFGAAPQQPQGGQPGGLFGAQTQAAQPFSQGLQGMGQQSQGVGGLFGGAGQTSAFGQPQQQQNPMGQTSAFGGAPGGFNSLAQGSNSAFTAQQPATSAFGQTPNAFGTGASGGTGGLFQQNAQQPGQTGAFGQTQSAFGAQQKSSLFGATSSFQQPGAMGQQQTQGLTGGLFGQPQSQPGVASQQSFGGGLGGANAFGQQQPNAMGQQPLGVSTSPIYAKPQEYAQQVSSVQTAYQVTFEVVQDQKVKENVPNLAIQSIRGMPQFKQISNEMLRILDMQTAKGQMVQSYEHKAMTEFNQNPSAYPLLELSKQRSQTNGQTAQPAQTQSAFGGTPQQQQQPGLFGQTQPLQQQPLAGGLNQFAQPGQQSSFNQSQGLLGGPRPANPFGQNPAGQGTGGLFAQSALQPQNQPQQTSSLFGPSGQPQNPQQPLGGGLFSQQSQTPGQNPISSFAQPQQPQGGLFANAGQAQAQQTSSLFGPKPGQPGIGQPGLGQPGMGLGQPGLGQQAQPQQPQGTGLFSQQQQQQPQQATSLFGPSSQQKPLGQQSSLFGPTNTQQPAQTSTNGLFSQQPKPATGLFGPQQSAPQSNLFGPPANAGAPTNFMQQQPQQTMPQGQATSNLFGPPSQIQQPTGGLIGPWNQQQVQASGTGGAPQAAALFNPMNIYLSQDPYGINNGFMSKPPESVEAIKKELEAISQSASKISSITDQFTQSSNSQVQPKNDQQYVGYMSHEFAIPQLPLSIDQAGKPQHYEEDEISLKRKQSSKYGQGSQLYNSEINAIRKERQSERMSQNSSNYGYLDLSKRQCIQTPSIYSNYNSVDRELLQPKEEKKDVAVPDLGRRLTQSISNMTGLTIPDIGSSTSSDMAVYLSKRQNTQDLIKITVVLKYDSCRDQELEVTMHKSRDVKDLENRTQVWLCKKFNFLPEKGQRFRLMFKNRTLYSTASLSDSDVKEDAKVFVQIIDNDDQKADQTNDAKPSKAETKQGFKEVEQKETSAPPASKDQVPKAPKSGYKVSPSMEELAKMSLKQLKEVEDFEVSNEFGKVRFLDKTDVTCVDLEDIITIKHRSVEVYDDTRHSGINKPPVGQKLNKPALITIKQIFPKKNATAAQKEASLKAALAQDPEGAEHLSYDANTGVWEFKVQHFTKWGADDSDEDEDQDDSIEPNQKQPVQEESKQSAFLAVLQATQGAPFKAPFESVKVAKKEDDADMEFSQVAQAPISVYQQPPRFPNKRRHLDSGSERGSITISVALSEQPPSGEMRQFSQQLGIRDRATQVEENIRRRESAFKEVSPLSCVKPSDKETMDYLRQLGLKSGFAKTSLRSGIPRPSFGPNGQITFVSGNRIKVVNTVPAEPAQTFTPAKSVLDHSQIEKKNEQDLDKQMGRMNLTSKQDQPILDSGLSFAHKMLFDDKFFLNLLQKDLPRTVFCPSEAAKSSQKVQLTRFLITLAENMVQAVKNQSFQQGEKLKHEFITVCMLNALFGNPNLHLVQLHSAYKGPQTFKRDLKSYESSCIEDETSVQSLKKRRNAISEVLRFHCQQMYSAPACPQNSNDQTIFATALALLQNGDVRGAVKHLTSFKKSKLAMMVSRAVNSQLSTSLPVHQSNNPMFLAICAHISSPDNQPQQQWDKDLLRSLMFTAKPNQSIIDIIRAKDQQQCNSPSILWSLLKLYANCRDADQAFKKFATEIAPQCSQRDYRLRWLVQLVLRQSMLSEGATAKESGNSVYGQQAQLEDSYFVQTSCQYVRQLLASADWRSALVVCLLMPTQFSTIRNRLTYEVLSQQAGRLLSQRKEDLDYITQKLNLPGDWIQVSQALCLQNLNLYEKAMDMWLRAGNVQLAHQIWHEKILPLYMNRTARLSLLKLLHLGEHLNQAERQALILDQKICERNIQVDRQVNVFAGGSALINNWDSRTGNFKKFISLLKELADKGLKTGDSCRSFSSVIKQIQKYSRDDSSDPVDHFIGQEIATIGNFLQMKEDQANVQEGRDQHAGVVHYAGANQFKFQSDAKFVQQNQPRVAREAEQLVTSQLLNRLSSE